MKKLLAAALLIIHLFNLAGYPFLFKYFIAQSAQQISEKIDKNNFSDSELTELKIALNLPYITPWTGYEKFEGEITIQGNHYNYVKRKISEDTLYLLCLPNKQKDKLQLAKNNYSKAVNDFNNNEKNDKTIKKINFLNQYHSTFPAYLIITPQKAIRTSTSFLVSTLPDSFIDVDGRPPQLIKTKC